MIDKKEVEKIISFEDFYSKYFPEHKILSNSEWQVLCPFHDDHNPSMNVNIKSGLYFCHSCNAKGDYLTFYQKKTGKSFPDSVNELGQHLNLQPIKPKITQTYDYTDVDGNLISQTVRYEPKQFRQRIKKDDKWVWSLKGVETVLYNLPEVIKAKTVLIVEGEKDCDNAKKLGYTATTCPMGAEKWREKYNEHLYGKDIILIPDNDMVGIKHMVSVGNQLKHKSTVKWFEFPETNKKGFDFTDLINSFPNEFLAMQSIDNLIRSARAFDVSKIIIPEPDTKESNLIKEWIKACPGEFSTKDVDYDLGFKETKQKQERTKILEKFVS